MTTTVVTEPTCEAVLPNIGLPVDVALVTYETTPGVRKVIAGMGRSEDVKFSPDCRRLAIAGFTLNEINLLAVEVVNNGNLRELNIRSSLVIESSSFIRPHGIEFIDNRHMVIANREGKVHVFQLPEQMEGSVRLNPIATIQSRFKGKVKSPGSVDCYKLSDDRFRILACNNYIHTITAHTVQMKSPGPGGSPALGRIKNEGVLLHKGLTIPDGVCTSRDRRWLAISNHLNGAILLYRLDRKLTRKTMPFCSLNGAVCPHGIRFSPDGDTLFVADSASPYLHMFKRSGAEWCSAPRASKSVRIMTDEVFQRGRYNDEEGGLKGIDIMDSENLLVVTSEHYPLAFYDLSILQQLPGLQIDDEIREKSRLRDEAMAVYGY